MSRAVLISSRKAVHPGLVGPELPRGGGLGIVAEQQLRPGFVIASGQAVRPGKVGEGADHQDALVAQAPLVQIYIRS